MIGEGFREWLKSLLMKKGLGLMEDLMKKGLGLMEDLRQEGRVVVKKIL